MGDVVRHPPAAVAGMRLDAFQCAGPPAPLCREVDVECVLEQKKNYTSLANKGETILLSRVEVAPGQVRCLN